MTDIITDPTTLYVKFADAYQAHSDENYLFENMPACTTQALVELLMDDDPGDDIQFRAERRKAAESLDALARALHFARSRLGAGTEIDQAHARGIDELLRKAGLELSAPPVRKPTLVPGL